MALVLLCVSAHLVACITVYESEEDEYDAKRGLDGSPTRGESYVVTPLNLAR